MGYENKEFWDNMALHFPRYSEKDNEFQQSLIRILKDKRLIDNNTSVLDIGCGTGVYTIPIAKEIKNTVALDISDQMLEFLSQDASTYNVNQKIETRCVPWDEYKFEEKFDLVFASLSAAFSEESDYERILKHSGKNVCILDFAETKGSNFEKLLKNNYAIEEHVYTNIEELKIWLGKKNIEYSTVALRNYYSRYIELELAISEIRKEIEASGKNINVSEDEIIELLTPLMQDNKVKYELDMQLELVYWEV